MLQVGAQNQNTAGFPANAAPSNSPPPTRGARKFKASGTPMLAGLTVDTEALPVRGVESEQPATTAANRNAVTAAAA